MASSADHSYCILSYSDYRKENRIELLGLSKDQNRAFTIAREACQTDLLQHFHDLANSTCYSFVKTDPHENHGHIRISDVLHGKKIVEYRAYTFQLMTEEYVIKEFFGNDEMEPQTVSDFVEGFGYEDDVGYDDICREFDMGESLRTAGNCSNPALATKIANYLAILDFGVARDHVDIACCMHAFAVVQVDYL